MVSMNKSREHVAMSRLVNASVDFEPNRTKSDLLETPSCLPVKAEESLLWNWFAMKRIDYKLLNEKMLHTTHEKNHFRMVFADFDDSPRRNTRAVVMKGSTPKRFGRYLRRTLQLSRQEGNDYVFLNAWNEWGEGNYLEPDVRHGYKYLKEIKAALEYQGKEI